MLQQYQPELLQFLTHRTAFVRQAALRLVGTLLRQGMLCPLDIIPHLIALQGDPELEIRRESLRLLQIEDEAHPTFLNNR